MHTSIDVVPHHQISAGYFVGNYAFVDAVDTTRAELSLKQGNRAVATVVSSLLKVHGYDRPIVNIENGYGTCHGATGCVDGSR